MPFGWAPAVGAREDNDMRNKRGIIALATALGTLGLAGHAFANDDCNRDADHAIGYDATAGGYLDSRLQVQVADFDGVDGGRAFDDDRFRRRRLSRAFYRLDINGDGVLARWELRRSGRFRRQFHRMDRNEDGVIARWEFRRAFRREW